MKTFQIEGLFVPASAITSIKPPSEGDITAPRGWKIFLADGRVLDINVGYWSKTQNTPMINQIKTYFGIDFDDV